MKKNNVIDESKKELLREVLNYSDEYLFEELTPRTLKKMHNFLVEHKCAETFKEIKSKNQINIKGCAPNGLERLIGKEIREQYGLDILEASEKFTTFYPIFSEGVIKYESVNGLHYTHFKVSSQTEKTFGMEIKEYKLYHNVFYLTYSIRIKEMSKHIPFYLSETVGEDIRHLLFSGPLSEEVDKEFSKLEKLMIRHTINNEQNYEEEMTIILYNTIANFRAVNFLWEKYNHDLLLHSISSDWFYDNDFFKINNWRYEIQGINDLDELYQKRLEDRIPEVIKSELKFFMKYEEFADRKKPQTYQQWCNYCFHILRKDVARQKEVGYRIDSWFVCYLNDFLVDIVLYHHDIEGYFVQIFGSSWAVDNLKELLNLTKDYSFDDRSDWGYEDENGMERMDKDRNFIEELIPSGVFSADGLVIHISDKVPNNDRVIKKINEMEEKK